MFRHGVRIGRLFGIELVLDYTWVFIVVLLTWSLTAVFGRWHPDWHLESVAVALAAAFLFFASIVAHELGHALVARSKGLRVRQIRLFLFGGVSDIEREPESPGAEFLIAIVGPVVSLVIGVVCLLFAGLFFGATEATDTWEALARLGPVGTILVWLGPINIILAVFNLIPGFPLDGGRVLRSVLWRATGNLMRATRWASNVGQIIGWCFVAVGVAMFFGVRVPLFGQGALGGVWLAFIGWFLSSAAARSYRGMLVEEVLSGVSVATLMRRESTPMPADTTIASAVTDWFMRSSEHMFPVMRGDDFVGIVCVGDIRRAPREAWATTPVAAVMTPLDALATAAPTDDASSALRKLGDRDVEQLPVVVDARLVGVLERAAVSRWLEMHLTAAPPPRPVAHGA